MDLSLMFPTYFLNEPAYQQPATDRNLHDNSAGIMKYNIKSQIF